MQSNLTEISGNNFYEGDIPHLEGTFPISKKKTRSIKQLANDALIGDRMRVYHERIKSHKTKHRDALRAVLVEDWELAALVNIEPEPFKELEPIKELETIKAKRGRPRKRGNVPQLYPSANEGTFPI